jgi:ketosteroid isomerase-like protein
VSPAFWRKIINTPIEVVRSFYSRLKVGDAPGALGLLASDIEWTTMWHYKVLGCTPQHVAEGLFKPLMAECVEFRAMLNRP